MKTLPLTKLDQEKFVRDLTCYYTPVEVKLDSLHMFPNYTEIVQSLEDVENKAQALMEDFKYDLNRPIDIVRGFPVKELPYNERTLLKGKHYIDIIINGHVRAVLFTHIGVDSILAYARSDIKTYENLIRHFHNIQNLQD
jgi:hypothetical protein